MKSIKLLIYYLLCSKLPHSRYVNISNRLRCWYVSKVLKIMDSGKKSYFENNIYIARAESVKIGKNCQINENVFIQGATIGDHVMIAPGVSILSSTHNYDRIDIPMTEQGEIKGLVPEIGDDVWIGRNVIVLPGVKVGKGVIIAAGAVVSKDIEDYCVVGGVPAKIIRKRK